LKEVYTYFIVWLALHLGSYLNNTALLLSASVLQLAVQLVICSMMNFSVLGAGVFEFADLQSPVGTLHMTFCSKDTSIYFLPSLKWYVYLVSDFPYAPGSICRLDSILLLPTIDLKGTILPGLRGIAC
jgi:hypothetical protein